MRPLGRKHTKTLGPMHADCAICHPPTKAGRAKEKRETQREIEAHAAQPTFTAREERGA